MKKIILSLLLMVSTYAYAQQEGPTIDGGLQMTVTSTGNINASVGKDTTASQAIGAIESGNIKGDLTMTVTAEGNINAAVGDGSCADQQIGTIGKKSSCK
jgi:hypothetical protein